MKVLEIIRYTKTWDKLYSSTFSAVKRFSLANTTVGKKNNSLHASGCQTSRFEILSYIFILELPQFVVPIFHIKLTETTCKEIQIQTVWVLG